MTILSIHARRDGALRGARGLRLPGSWHLSRAGAGGTSGRLHEHLDMFRRPKLEPRSAAWLGGSAAGHSGFPSCRTWLLPWWPWRRLQGAGVLLFVPEQSVRRWRSWLCTCVVEVLLFAQFIPVTAAGAHDRARWPEMYRLLPAVRFALACSAWTWPLRACALELAISVAHISDEEHRYECAEHAAGGNRSSDGSGARGRHPGAG